MAKKCGYCTFSHISCLGDHNVQNAHMNDLLDALLAPIARLAIAKAVPFAQVAERLKLQFVRAASQEAGADKPPTDSRISVMTGLQRRDIARLRNLPPQVSPPANHLARLVAQWQLRHGGEALTRDAFDDLARDIRKDVHPRTQLEQLIAAGTVGHEGDRLVLRAASYQPFAGSQNQLDHLAAQGRDFLAAATDNALAIRPRHFERAVHYNGLSAAAVAQLDALYRDRQMAVLQEINALAARLQEEQPGHVRFRAGGYFYRKDRDAQPPRGSGA